MATKDKKVTEERNTSTSSRTSSEPSLMDKLQTQLESNQSYLSLVLGLLIVFVVGILVFNYFKQNNSNLGPAQQTANEDLIPTQEAGTDVDPNNLPGKYTVKEGDTLFDVAEKYYADGYKYDQLITANKLTDENNITVGQVLDIPKLEGVEVAQASPAPTEQTSNNITPSVEPTTEVAAVSPSPATSTGTGGAENVTTWGEKIAGDSYTVVEGDWLSTISGRAYGDIMQYSKIAQANNISNPDLITPGTVIQIPR